MADNSMFQRHLVYYYLSSHRLGSMALQYAYQNGICKPPNSPNEAAIEAYLFATVNSHLGPFIFSMAEPQLAVQNQLPHNFAPGFGNNHAQFPLHVFNQNYQPDQSFSAAAPGAFGNHNGLGDFGNNGHAPPQAQNSAAAAPGAFGNHNGLGNFGHNGYAAPPPPPPPPQAQSFAAAAPGAFGNHNGLGNFVYGGQAPPQGHQAFNNFDINGQAGHGHQAFNNFDINGQAGHVNHQNLQNTENFGAQLPNFVAFNNNEGLDNFGYNGQDAVAPQGHQAIDNFYFNGQAAHGN